MTMTESYQASFANLKGENLATATKKIRRFDTISEENLTKRYETTQLELKAELEQGLIKYEPRCGYLGKSHGYSLTNAGIKKIWVAINQ